MIASEVAALLGRVAAFDRRPVGRAEVAAWQAALDDIGYREAEAAVVEHFRASTDWLMPAHVRRLVAAARSERVEAAGPALYDGCDDLDGAAYVERRRANLARVLDQPSRPEVGR